MLATIILAAAVTCTSPQGHILMLGNEVVPPDHEVLWAMKTAGKGQGELYMAESSGNWYAIALAADSAFTWPAHQTVAAVDLWGRETVASELFVMSPRPEERMIPLGLGPVRIEPGNLWRKPWRHGQAIVMCARFGDDWKRPRRLVVVSRSEAR